MASTSKDLRRQAQQLMPSKPETAKMLEAGAYAMEREKAARERIAWYRDGYREMDSWTPEVASERTTQYALDTLSGPPVKVIDDLLSEARNQALEEAAQVALTKPMRFAGMHEANVREAMADAIRALKEKTE